jgi:hypothetical protein
MRILLVIIIAALSAGCSKGVKLGDIFPPYQDGTESQYGSCKSPSLGHRRTCEFAVEILQSTDGAPISILVLRATKENPQDDPSWQVTDIVQYPEVRPGDFISLHGCRVNGEFDGSAMAVIRDGDDQWLRATNWAGAVDFETGRFIRIPPADVECENEGWGI